jgi:hypothetical protein
MFDFGPAAICTYLSSKDATPCMNVSALEILARRRGVLGCTLSRSMTRVVWESMLQGSTCHTLRPSLDAPGRLGLDGVYILELQERVKTWRALSRV